MRQSTDDMMKALYGWQIAGDKIIPPEFNLPKSVKERANYFVGMMQDRLNLLGVLTFIFSEEEPPEYEFGATKPWLPMESAIFTTTT